LEVVRVQDTVLSEADDPVILVWAARHGYILLTHDYATMADFAYDRVRSSLPMPGVFEISQDVPIGQVVADLVLVAQLSFEGEYEGRVVYFPL
jgi:hypothetical protein